MQRILDTANIVEVVSDFVHLRRRGANYIGLCPFHSERTPSFSVSPSRGICKCFSCGKGGSPVNFIMEHEQLTYWEALRWLANKYHIEIQEHDITDDERREMNDRQGMMAANDFAMAHFEHNMQDTADGREIGLAYFRERGINDWAIKRFHLGYSLDKRNDLLNAAKEAGLNEKYLVDTGLCIRTDRGDLYDRFKARVMYPVFTISGKVVAFGGRTLRKDKEVAKYVNSPESLIYSKSRELYGLYQAKQAIVKKDKCILVEGYMDVISMHQQGVENVVASSGTALTPGQIRMIHRFTNNMTVLYDGDAAGIKASIRGIDMLLEEGMNVKVCLLPDGDDPDSFARKHNSTEFQAFISEHETDFIRFKTNLLLEDAGKDPIKRAELIGNLVQSISVIPEAIVRDVYIKECAQLLHIEDKLLVSEVAKRRETQAEKRAEQTERDRRIAERAASMPQGEQVGNMPAPNGDVPLPPEIAEAGYTESPFPPQEDNYASFIPQEGKEGQEFYKFERLILQAVVRYGEKVMCNLTDEEGNEIPVTVIEYVVNDLKEDDLAFHNPLHRQMLSEAAAHMHDSGFIAERYFLAHPDPIISKLSVDLINVRYQLSKYHSKSQKIVTDEERLYELVPMLMINFKYAIVTEELKHMLYALQDPALAHDNEKCDSLMQRYNELRTVQSIMAKRLGDRVVLR